MTQLTSSGRRVRTGQPGETRILVERVAWETYARFVEGLPEGSPVRVAFDGKDMEIMVTGPVHDHYSDLLDQFIKVVAGELGIKLKPQRETTWKRAELLRGVESDNCYYLDTAKIDLALQALRRRSNDVADYPNPDLVVEVDISPPEADRGAIYSAMRVAEVWRFDGEELTIERLGDDLGYHRVEASQFLRVQADQVPRWLLDEDLGDYEAWTVRVREWVRQSIVAR